MDMVVVLFFVFHSHILRLSGNDIDKQKKSITIARKTWKSLRIYKRIANRKQGNLNYNDNSNQDKCV